MSISLEAACGAVFGAMRRKRPWLAAAFVFGLCTAASADDVLFENVRIFDGKGATALYGGPVVLVGNVLLGELNAMLIGGYPGTPVEGATVTFRATNTLLGDPVVCTAVTDVNGYAHCKPTLVGVTQLVLASSVKISYAGDARWQPSGTVVADCSGLIGGET